MSPAESALHAAYPWAQSIIIHEPAHDDDCFGISIKRTDATVFTAEAFADTLDAALAEMFARVKVEGVA